MGRKEMFLLDDVNVVLDKGIAISLLEKENGFEEKLRVRLGAQVRSGDDGGFHWELWEITEGGQKFQILVTGNESSSLAQMYVRGSDETGSFGLATELTEMFEFYVGAPLRILVNFTFENPFDELGLPI